MTEADWMSGYDAVRMLRFIMREKSRSKRKLRLFACACARRVTTLMNDGANRFAVETAERFADGLATQDELSDSMVNASHTRWGGLISRLSARHAEEVRAEVEHAFMENRRNERYSQSDLLREFFGNPFRPITIDPRLLTSNVVDVAQAIYQERTFEKMPILADALMDAGCDSEEMIDHCRGPGPHVRGCWVVDLLLKNE